MQITERASEEEQSNSKENSKENSKPTTLKAFSVELPQKQQTLAKVEEPLEDENGEINISLRVVSQPPERLGSAESKCSEKAVVQSSRSPRKAQEQAEEKEAEKLLKKRTSSFL